ncbi:MAG: CDP-alcohol phosphatidyltransferase family protein [Planctomycetes bacterium]|nr:CDP-alcohol phosphatidyltransferase family protein [Planctomycetota bacterium]
MTVPDGLTALRAALIAPCAGLIALGHGLGLPSLLYLAAATLAVAGATDAIDGPLARRLGCESRFGRIADPVSDKLLILACLIGLWPFGAVPTLPAAVIGIREIGSLGLWALSAVLGAPLSPNIGGKSKFFLQTFAVGALIIEGAAGSTGIGRWAIWMAAAWTAVTGIAQWIRSRGLWKGLAARLAERRGDRCTGT